MGADPDDPNPGNKPDQVRPFLSLPGQDQTALRRPAAPPEYPPPPPHPPLGVGPKEASRFRLVVSRFAKLNFSEPFLGLLDQEGELPRRKPSLLCLRLKLAKQGCFRPRDVRLAR
jgi:hypothetical protein